jgi:hypothetical protein
MRIVRKTLPVLVVLSLFGAVAVWASITGSISGIVTDPSGSVVPNATVTATNVDTGVQSSIKTDGAGFYNFPNLPVGNYDIEVTAPGFKTYSRTAIRIDANSVVSVDVKLAVGAIAEKVMVRSDVVQVETQSTQMGEVINTEKILATPLNGRDFTNLLSLQPGVVPYLYANATSDVNLQDRHVGGSGTQNGGNQSINGQRETANGFMVNGANVNEGKNNGTAIIPNLDSIEEFRIITNNFDPEYGNYSGGQVNVVTKSGTNTLHGSAFEFLRNTVLDARNFFNTSSSSNKLIQNQFGGTVGGPLHKDKLFFFLDYQGTRRIDAPTQTQAVPSATDLTGDLSDGVAGTLGGAVGSDAMAAALNQRLMAAMSAQTVMTGEPYFFTGCSSTDPVTGCVFPTQKIPMTLWSPAARGIVALGLIPSANIPAVLAGNYSTSSFDRRQRDDKLGGRLDYNTTSYGTLSAYWHGDDSTVHDPFPSGGATVASPTIGSYDALSRSRDQVAMLSDTKSFGSTAVNEFRFSYLRSANRLLAPEGGLTAGGNPITLASLGFLAPAGSGPTFNGGIGPIAPQFEGVPSIVFGNQLSGTNIGVPQDSPTAFNNSFQLCDNFSKVIGRHSIKFGGQFHYDQINERNLFGENGVFTFNGGETGTDFADFLIGAPSGFIQATKQFLDSRTKYAGIYGQDSWRVTPNLTFNYGLRWELIQPWYDTEGKIETLVPGRQSVLFPGAPTGWVVPGDPGIPKTLAPTQYHNFAPRVGLAYSPSWDSGFLAKLTGGPGKTSIRAGFGLFYSSMEDLAQFQEVGDAPYGLFFSAPSPVFFEKPFEDRSGNIVQRFPFAFPPKGVSAKNPDTTFCWMQGPSCPGSVLPISGSVAFKNTNKVPYAENYELSLQREFGTKTLLTVSYVGNQAHKLLTSIESNPGNQLLCVQLMAEGCGGFGESGVYTLPAGMDYPSAATPAVELVPASQCGTHGPTQCVVNGTYTVFGPQNGVQVFGNNPYIATIAQSSYNSLQASVRHTSGLATFLFGYTYSKCIDNGSGLIEGINPFNPKASLSLCGFDVTQNFVASYEVKLPFDRAFHADSGWANKLAAGWAISGLTTFATGLPVSISEPDDNSFTGTQNTSAPVDLPNLAPGPILTNTNPRSGQAYFNTALFSAETSGTIGNSPRRFFHGPGLNNWDMALLKTTRITESKTLEFRFEAFDIWNHTQFKNPGGVFGSMQFGAVSAAQDPRIMQAALKFLF